MNEKKNTRHLPGVRVQTKRSLLYLTVFLAALAQLLLFQGLYHFFKPHTARGFNND